MNDIETLPKIAQSKNGIFELFSCNSFIILLFTDVYRNKNYYEKSCEILRMQIPKAIYYKKNKIRFILSCYNNVICYVRAKNANDRDHIIKLVNILDTYYDYISNTINLNTLLQNNRLSNRRGAIINYMSLINPNINIENVNKEFFKCLNILNLTPDNNNISINNLFNREPDDVDTKPARMIPLTQ